MTKDEIGKLVAERQFRKDESRVQIRITPTIPIFTLRRGQALRIDPSVLPTAELTALGFTATVELSDKTWRIEGFSCSVEIDPRTGEATIERGAIVCEEVMP